MPTFPKYESYKDSGVEWLGEIPNHWQISRLKHSIQSATNGIWGGDIDEDNENDGVVCIRVADFNRQNLSVSLDKLTRRKVTDSEFQSRKLSPGDLLLEKSGGGDNQLVGQVVIFEHDFPAVCSNFLARLITNKEFDSKFLNYVHATLYALRVNYKHIKQTTGIQNIDGNSYLSELFAHPALKEQRRIVEFLDRTTGEIDCAIAQKQRLIELLQEQKAILINQAVTKGLNPNVPMRDSGIEWLGEIPEHWQLKAFKRITTRVDVGIAEAATHAYTDQGVPIIRSGNVRTNYMDTREVLYIKEWFAEKNSSKYLSSGDILTVRTGANAGMTAVVPKELDHSQCFTLLVATPKPNQVSQFYSYYINTPMIQAVFAFEGWGAAQLNLSVPILKELPIVEPPSQEQQEIVSYLQKALSEFESTQQTTRRQISILQEYKQILIAYAVTGKIKV